MEKQQQQLEKQQSFEKELPSKNKEHLKMGKMEEEEEELRNQQPSKKVECREKEEEKWIKEMKDEVFDFGEILISYYKNGFFLSSVNSDNRIKMSTNSLRKLLLFLNYTACDINECIHIAKNITVESKISKDKRYVVYVNKNNVSIVIDRKNAYNIISNNYLLWMLIKLNE